MLYYTTTPKDMRFLWRGIRSGIDGKYDFEARYSYLKVLCRGKFQERV